MLTQTPNLNTKFSKKRNIGTITIVALLLASCLLPRNVQAATSSDGSYSIQFGSIDTDNQTPTRKPAPIINNPIPATNTTPNIPPKPPTYSIDDSNDAFYFELSQDTIDFGMLSATNPVIRTSEMTFSTPDRGAKVIASENHSLQLGAKNFIPDTSCDNGSCTETIPDLWTSNLTYGYGYRCESSFENTCDQGFSDQDAFKQFANESANESPQPIMLSQQSKQETTGKITYKINISGTQTIGDYSNVLTYIAVPNF